MAMPKPSPLRASSPRQQQGREAEEQALTMLQAKGLKLLARNFHCRFGELDLVMLDAGPTVVFVEVRSRRSNSHGGAAASLTRGKQEKVIAAAQYFLQHHARLSTLACRFDAVIRQGQQLEWIQAAFTI